MPLIYQSSPLSIYFGDVSDAITAACYQAIRTQAFIPFPAYNTLQKNNKLDQLHFLRQNHGCDGVVIHEKINSYLVPFAQDGDFLITKTPQIGLGIMTADCLPVIIYAPSAKNLSENSVRVDPSTELRANGWVNSPVRGELNRTIRDPKINSPISSNVVAIIHAGWRGAVAGIVPNVMHILATRYQIQASTCEIFFGPAAGACCYQVGTQFIENPNIAEHASNVIFTKESKIYFNLPHFVSLQLQQLGVTATNIHKEYCLCTIHNDHYHSYRRSGEKSGRQMTVAWLATK